MMVVVCISWLAYVTMGVVRNAGAGRPVGAGGADRLL